MKVLSKFALLGALMLGVAGCANTKPSTKPVEDTPIVTPEPTPEHKHEFGDWFVVTPATCTEKGQEKRKCIGEDCDEFELRDIEKLKHTPAVEWEVVTPATVEAAGEEVLKCSVCGEVLETREISKLEPPVEEVKVVYTFTKDSITILDESQKPTSYAAYNGEHEVNNVKFTTSDILANNYLDMPVIQFKAALGKITMVNDGYKKVKLTCVSTYDYDKNFTIDGKIGDNEVINQDKVETGKESVSGENHYPCYQYVLEVEVSADSENLVIEKTAGTKGAGYVTSIELYK